MTKALSVIVVLLTALVFAGPAAGAANPGKCQLTGSVPGFTGAGKVQESATVSCLGRSLEKVQVCPWYRTDGAWTQIASQCRVVTRRGVSSTAATTIPGAATGSYRAWSWAWTWPLCGSASASSSGQNACRSPVGYHVTNLSAPVSGLSLTPIAHHASFWNSTLALLIAVGICALLCCFTIWVALRRLRARGGVSDRVRSYVSTTAQEPAPTLSLADTAAVRTKATLSKSSWWPGFVQAVDIAMIEETPEKLVVYAVAGAGLMAALTWAITGSVLVGLLFLITPPFALRMYVKLRVRRQRNRFAELLPSHLEETAVAIRAGRSFIEAMNAVVDGAEEPLRREFERALRDESLGRPLEEALRVISERMSSASVEQAAIVAAMHRRTGSSVSEAIERVAEGARERADLQRELGALTAQGRMARWLLTFLPPVILLIMTLISPSYVHPLFHTTAGVIAMVIAGVMVIAGSLVMKKIVDIEV